MHIFIAIYTNFEYNQYVKDWFYIKLEIFDCNTLYTLNYEENNILIIIFELKYYK